MKVDVLLGLQWGDEGKGKGVDVLTPRYDVVARFQGGPNAGHSLEFNGLKHVLHLIPSGIFHPQCTNVICGGVVIDPVIFAREVAELRALGVEPTRNLAISRKAHLILPFHPLLDALSERAKGDAKIGSTLKGIGPAYRDKIGRDGLRVGDTERPDFRQRYMAARQLYAAPLAQVATEFGLEAREAEFFRCVDLLREFRFTEAEYEIDDHLRAGRRVLAEGAQGTLLDIDYGSYPFVTSSSTICGGACTGIGLAPSRVGEVIGIVKAYCTRVGAGPFPTELHDATGERLRAEGREFGATTGRPRRCGWLDLVALRYAVMVNGVTQLFLTKADVLDTFDQINVCVAYRVDGQETDRYTASPVADIEPVYRALPGWKESIAAVRGKEEIPQRLAEFIAFVEQFVGVRVAFLSVGPDRDATLEL